MAGTGVVECALCIGCTRWAYKRCTYIGAYDSESWPSLPSISDDFECVPRLCRLILAVYEDDLSNPKYAPPGGYGVNPDGVVKRVDYDQTQGRCPPYLIYVDHGAREVVLAMRGLNLIREGDYKVLMDNRLGMQMFDGGYVHHGLLKAAVWVLEREFDRLKSLWVDNGSCYKMVFAGHSLGSGVVALMGVAAVNHRNKLGGVPRELLKCYAIAPARCMSLNLAVKYADVISSVVLQRLGAEATTAPPTQKMERKQSMEKEHKDALERAVSLNVPYAVAPSESATEESHTTPPPEEQVEGALHGCSRSSGTNWDELVEKFFEKNATGNLVLKKDVGK
ncbi:hypothetical protein QJS04_geneDACA011858 [Acorus gramineus]|uniref:Uncharacterized protein n=1 Tax=Acorus gramineus TaxID=55184 RepID=A0AAV9AHX2_ACOGR|nr:hypothetical protein QJS04_geneDACA011858 [Acorus gramineus]